jgi:beta-lactamase superfamily II metal-dependent hydrolase
MPECYAIPQWRALLHDNRGKVAVADYFEIDFLGVETKKSGDAIAVRYEMDGEIFIHVVDGGYLSTAEQMVAHLNKHYGNPSYIDQVIATHNDGDHARGLISVLENYHVGSLWMIRPWEYADELLPRFETYTSADRLRSALRAAYPNLAALEDIANKRGIEIRTPFQGAQIGAFTVMAPTKSRYLDLIVTSTKTPEAKAEEVQDRGFAEVLFEKAKTVVARIKAEWGIEAFPAEDTSNENEMSVVQYAVLCDKRILLTADTGRDGLREVIDYAPYAGLSLPGIDRFQVPHHGGRRNVSTELLDELLGSRHQTKPASPTFTAIISSAKEDTDHPRNVVVRAMTHRGARVIATEGNNIRTSHNAPERAGWVAATPMDYPDSNEE